MIVVTAPTGHIGTHLLDRLLAHREAVRVIARDPARLPAPVRDRVEVVQGSHRDTDVVDRAFAGADAVFWLMPAEPAASSIYQTYVGDSIPAAEAIVARQVPRVVVVSALGRGTQLYAGHASASWAMDDLLRSTGAHVRALANPTFMDNVARQVVSLADHGALTGTLPGDQKAPTVATADIAATAATLLADHTWTGQDTVNLLGPEDLSLNDQAAILTEVLGTPVRYERTGRRAYKQDLLGYGMSEAVAQGLIDMDTAKEHGLDTAVSRMPENTTPTTFRQWATDVVKPAVDARSAR
ncbi:NAD(P)H-binding protein [Rhodococcus sp. D2-41]|uniref:NAD(P)H-binding protein n=1 Tax=Speluncibacter jeojiensis TaxID=2710754 RepID=UPI00240F3590|nr:NAD(P)H-binding protein [Rhodococcus sp. D2-41]MDG3012921.1 NAD(P)H-binding protein [Rhodococcus sp. D2-41]